tara:strand:- start:882 stop:1094 length:213 start_codon:yes stop_codon:yes gene_type:complete
MADLERKNELDIVQIRGELKLLTQKIDVIKNNDLRHIQRSVDQIHRILWGVGFLVLGQLAVGIRTLLMGA